ncbi:MAG: hypothetical protein ABSC87_06335 [Halobacteriota archaeon]
MRDEKAVKPLPGVTSTPLKAWVALCASMSSVLAGTRVVKNTS